MKKHILLATAAAFAMTPALAQQTQQSDEIQQNQQTQQSEMQGDLSAGMNSAEDFVAKAGMGDLFEIESAQIAEEQAESDEVRQFAQQLLEDHRQSARDLASAAQEADVEVAVLGRLQMELASTDLTQGSGSAAGGTSTEGGGATGTTGSIAGSTDTDTGTSGSITSGASSTGGSSASADAGASGSVTGGASGTAGTATGSAGLDAQGDDAASGGASGSAMDSAELDTDTDTGASGSTVTGSTATGGSGASGSASPSGAGTGMAGSDTHVDQSKTAMLDPEHEDMIDDLRNASGEDFDRRFLEIQIQVHEEAIDAFERYSENGEEEALRQHAEQALPSLREHLERAQSIQDDLG